MITPFSMSVRRLWGPRVFVSFYMETNSQRTVKIFSTRTLIVSSASLCSRPAKLPVLWQRALFVDPRSIHTVGRFLVTHSRRMVVGPRYKYPRIQRHRTSVRLVSQCPFRMPLFIAPVLANPKCAGFSLICLLVLPLGILRFSYQ
jgi:hypothetical protein